MPHSRVARISDAGQNIHFAYFFGFHAKNGYKSVVSFIFGSELDASRYGPPLGWADTKTRPKPAPKIKNYVSRIFFLNLHAKRP